VEYLVHGHELSMGTVVLQLDNGLELYCSILILQENLTFVCGYIIHKKKVVTLYAEEGIYGADVAVL
jgi:hypothetical protein